MAAIYAEDEGDFNERVNKDIESFQNIFNQKFPAVEISDYANGVYALDKASREQWLEIEEFPLYELDIDLGNQLFDEKFANGKGYSDCFANDGIGIVQAFPFYDIERKEVITLELAINECRIINGEKPLGYKRGKIALISAYMMYHSRGNTIDVSVPNEDAYNAYLAGKNFFNSKRGQLNFSCSDCHIQLAGMKLRADIAGPALGHTTGFPTYRSGWGELGTLHRRYAGCNKQVRALPFAAQSTEYRQLEYYQAIMNRDLKLNGPSSRK